MLPTFLSASDSPTLKCISHRSSVCPDMIPYPCPLWSANLIMYTCMALPPSVPLFCSLAPWDYYSQINHLQAKLYLGPYFLGS